MNRIKQAFKKKALITYITGGDPCLELTEEIILTLNQAGVDLIEIGIPFSDPLADGPVIQTASQRALKGGATLKKIIKLVSKIKDKINTPIILMGYYNSILSYGQKEFISDLRKANIAGVIIPDLPYEQDPEFYQSLKENDIAGILLVAPNTSKKRLKEIGDLSTGFLYCVSLLGVTGDKEGPSLGIDSYLKQIRKQVKLPLALGFGIDGPEKVKSIIEHVDGIIIGSALIKIMEKHIKEKEEMLAKINEFIIDIKKVMN